jgi:hypothetical protein
MEAFSHSDANIRTEDDAELERIKVMLFVSSWEWKDPVVTLRGKEDNLCGCRTILLVMDYRKFNETYLAKFV